VKVYTGWHELTRDGLKPLQEREKLRYAATQHFRCYTSTLLPGLLQTEQYAAAELRRIARSHDMPVTDSAEAARARVTCSRLVHEPGHRFDFIIEESVLRCQIADPGVMSAQLAHLLTLDALPSVSLSIIPDQPAVYERAQWPRESFHIFDETVVTVELVSGQLTFTMPSDIAQYLKAFSELRAMAVCGAEARPLIVKALQSLR
jgi:hypothetical protein